MNSEAEKTDVTAYDRRVPNTKGHKEIASIKFGSNLRLRCIVNKTLIAVFLSGFISHVVSIFEIRDRERVHLFFVRPFVQSHGSVSEMNDTSY